MTSGGQQKIRSLFSTQRPIDRPIEKVIDYYATDPARLRAEVEEYEVTESVERNLRRFLDVFGDGVRSGEVAETGIWVSGFYGSGKSSFTKYLGFALDPHKEIDGVPFLELFSDRIHDVTVRQELKTLAAQEPTAVVMLDLGSEQLASSSAKEVSLVLYWKVLQWAGYSREDKLAQLELHLDRDGRYADFQRAYEEEFGEEWTSIHNDPLVAVPRADRIVPWFYPKEYPEPGAFRSTRFSMTLTARELAADMIEIARRRSGHRNILFLIDEVGQYVAPSGSLILNLDGLARNLKELGEGRVWMVATGQQTLAEIVERAAYNSTELNKLRDRFPIGIELDARDIREITHRRLLEKSPMGEATLRALFKQHGQAMASHTRLSNTTLFKGNPSEELFIRFYPLLPQHFDLLLELVRGLARSRGGLGLRSAIRVIQDLLVDASKALPAGSRMLADAPVGMLATVDAFYDTLRADINKLLPHVITAVDRIERSMPSDKAAIRVGKAVGVLQLLEANFPRNPENIAALLYQRIGDASNIDEIRAALTRLLDLKEIGLVEDPQAGGFTFLSEDVGPLRERRNMYQPTTAELATLRSTVIKGLFDPLPAATISGSKTVKAGLRWSSQPLTGDEEEIQIQVETATNWDQRRTALLTDTTGGREWQQKIAWLIQPNEGTDDALAEIARSQKVLREVTETEANKDQAQFARSERRSMEAQTDRASRLFRDALMTGTLIFRGKATPADSVGVDPTSSARQVLGGAAAAIYPKYHLCPIRPSTDLAVKFLGVDRLDRMPADTDPLKLVRVANGRGSVDQKHPVIVEALTAFRTRLEQQETSRLQGGPVLDLFAAAPYGWSKDVTRYVLAALLMAGEILLHTPSGEVKTPGPAANEAFKSTVAFGKVGVGLRGVKPPLEMLDRAAHRLDQLIGQSVMPLEDRIAQAAREGLPPLLSPLADLPTRLRLQGIAGAERAQGITDSGNAILDGDGAGAVPILGAVECSFPDDLRWAQEMAKALDNAEDDIRRVQSVVQEADSISRFFPSAGDLIEDADREAIDDVLKSESFYQRLPDLRTTLRKVEERAAERYTAQSEKLSDSVEAIRMRMEAHPKWAQLSDDDREELIGRLPSAPAGIWNGMEALSAIGPLLGQQQSLTSLEVELRSEIERLAPDDSDTGNGVVRVDIATMLPSEPIGDAGALDRWLALMRSALSEKIAAGQSVRVTIGGDDSA